VTSAKPSYTMDPAARRRLRRGARDRDEARADRFLSASLAHAQALLELGPARPATRSGIVLSQAASCSTGVDASRATAYRTTLGSGARPPAGASDVLRRDDELFRPVPARLALG